MKPKRPWRVTVAGGRCVGTYAVVDRARARAEHVVLSGQANASWVRHRTEDLWEEFNVARAIDAHPPLHMSEGEDRALTP